MKNLIKWYPVLIVFPILSGYLGYTGHGFFFKAGVAGSGILLLFTLYYAEGALKKDIWFILAAFGFSIIGDWFMATRNENTLRFISGILFFFMAHLGYLVYSLLNGKPGKIFTIALLVIYLVFFAFFIYPSVTEIALLTAAFLYLIISCLSLGAAFGILPNTPSKWYFFSGIAMLLFSDTIIALGEFAGYNKPGFLILPTYYLSQIAVTLSLIIRRISNNA